MNEVFFFRIKLINGVTYRSYLLTTLPISIIDTAWNELKGFANPFQLDLLKKEFAEHPIEIVPRKTAYDEYEKYFQTKMK